jgi:hypothetical protein
MARIAKGVDSALVQKAVPIVKKLGDAKDSAKFDAIEKQLKVARPMAAKLLYAAEAVIDPKLKFKLTYVNIEKARTRGLRWERIAAYTGTSVPQVQAEFIDGGGDLTKSYTGKGRLPAGVTPAPAKPAGKKPAAGKKGGKPAAKPAAKPATSAKGGGGTKTRRKPVGAGRP